MPIQGPASTVKATGVAQSKAKIGAKKPNPSQVFIQSPQGPVGYNVFGGRPTNPSFIKQFQRAAKALGLYKGAIDGVWGPQSARAWAIYNQAPNAKFGRYGSTLGAQASYGLFQAQYIKQQIVRIQRAYEQLQQTTNRLRGQGQINELDQAIMLSQYWAQQGGEAGGAFKKQAAQAQKQLYDLNKIQAEYTRQLNEQSKQEKRALNPSTPMRVLGWIGRDIVAPVGRSPVGKALGLATRALTPPAVKRAGELLFEGVNLGHELINRAVYAEQFLRNQRGEKGGFRFNPFISAEDQQEQAGVLLGALGLKRFQSKKIQAALSATEQPYLRERLRAQGKLKSFGEYATGHPGWESTLVDFFYNFADPTLAVGKVFKTLTLIDDAAKAEKLASKAPAALDSLTRAISVRAAKVASRAPVGLDIGDVKLLQKQVSSLRAGRKGTSELAAALASKGVRSPLAYLKTLEDTALKAVEEGKNVPAARQFLSDVRTALSKLTDQGMTTETRQAILRASLGRTWKPQINIGLLALGKATPALSRLSAPLTERALAAMPYATRQAKAATLTRLLRGQAGEKITFVGKFVNNPREGNLLRFAERTSTEQAAAKQLLDVLGKKKFPIDTELKALTKRLNDLADSPLKDILLERLDDVQVQVQEYLKAQLDSLTSQQKGWLNSKTAVELMALVKDQKKLVRDAKGAKATLRAQTKLNSLQRVLEVKQGKVAQPALVKTIQQLRKESVGFAKLHPVSLDRAVENFNSELRDYNYMIGSMPATRISPWTRVVRAAGRTFNDIPKSLVNMWNTDDRTKAMRDWAIALGVSKTDADSIYARMAQTMRSEDALEEAKKIQGGVIRNFFVQEGLPPEAVKEALQHIDENAQEFLREYRGWYSILDERARRFKAKFNKVYDVDGAKDPQVLSQYQYMHHLVDPGDLRRYVLDWHRRNDSILHATRAGAEIAGTTLLNLYRPLHYFFKFTALTAAPARYILRVAFLEERLRMWMTHGFASATQVSSKYARRLNNLSLEATAGSRWFGGFAEVGIEGLPMSLMHHSLIEVAGHGVIKKGERAFTENLHEILMKQVRPELDMLHHLLMPHLWTGDEAAMAAAKESAKEFIETTEKGRVYFHKALMVDKANRDVDHMMDRTEKWLKEVMPNQAIIDKRLNGQFSLKELEKHEEWFPDKIWGDKYESLFKPGSPRSWKDTWGRLIIQSPTTALNRQPFAYAEFAKEFDSLTASGLDSITASEWATQYAVHRTNEILYDASVRTRFAYKTDIAFPFQQAREETIRVWGKLLREHPARAAYALGLFSRAFNAGINNHIIVKNQYGEWVMKVPGSPELSRALGRWAPMWVPFREGLGATAGTSYSFPLQGLLFVNDAWGTIPRPGGPWWVSTANVAVHLKPDLFPRTKFWQKYFFDERNPTTLWLRPEISRLWMAATGQKIIPWEPFSWGHIGYNEPAGERIYDKMAGEMGAELIKQWIDDGAKPGDKPTAEDVANATRAALFMHGLIGMFVPSATTPTTPAREDFNTLSKQYSVDGQLDFRSLLAGHPDMAGFAFSHTRDPVRAAYTRDDGTVDVNRLMAQNPGYWEHWRQRGSPREGGPDALVDQIYMAKDYLSPEEFIAQVDKNRRISQAWATFNSIIGNPGLPAFQRVSELAQLEKDNSDLGEWQDKRLKDYRRDLEFDMLMKQPTALRSELLKAWQYKYDVSFNQMARLQNEWVAGEKSHFDPWMEARNTIDVVNEFQRNNTGQSVTTWASTHLTPAEQFNFYTYMLGTSLDVQEFNKMYAARGKTAHDHAKELFHHRLNDTVNLAEQWWAGQRHDASTTIQKKYDHINAISKLMSDTAEAAKAAHGAQAHALWNQFFALKDKRNRVYAEIRGIQNSLYKQFPDLRSAADEVRLMQFVGRDGPAAFKKNGLDHYGIPHLTDNQENKWNEMPERIRQDYVQDLVERITLPAFYTLTKRGESRLYWDYLTEFQKDILRNRLDKKQLDMVKRMSSDAAAAEGFGGRGHFRRFRRHRWQIHGFTLGNGFGELAFALEMFKQYNRRGTMPEPTDELKEYRRLKDNPILKAQYLKAHPRLQAWLRAGPMANMPPVVADIVFNTMVKYGRWQSDKEVLSWDDLAELGFAHTILKKYNKREGEAPKAYELWLKMPTGKARFDFMKQHPEIEAWLQDGPMAQMPQEFREVIRDIMTKFGEWTSKTDPLSVLLDQYYATPDHAKQQFLEEHPEIIAYWRAIRTGRDRMLFDLAQGYFALADADSKKAYLLAHPEVQDFFIEERHRRYESFLQDVARYLGHVPELAEHYLRDQTKFIRDILDKFAQRPLVPAEVTRVSTSTRRSA